MKPSSFSVVATESHKRELALLIFSIRQFYTTPIYIWTDDQTKSYLSIFDFCNLETRIGANPDDLEIAQSLTEGVEDKNEFHKKEAILLKMDCIEWAVSETGNTFFVDADLVFNQAIDEDIDDDFELIISPHYHIENRINANRTYGAFNAGYLWTRSIDLAEVWRRIFLKQSRFYEQEGMKHFFDYFDTGVFSKSHNFGFWRFSKYHGNERIFLNSQEDFSKVKSFHFHAFPETYAHANDGLKKGYDKLAKVIIPKLNPELREFIHDL